MQNVLLSQFEATANRRKSEKSKKMTANTNLGAKIAQTIKCLRSRLTEIQEHTASSSWKKQNHRQTKIFLWLYDTIMVTMLPNISHPKVFRNKEQPAIWK